MFYRAVAGITGVNMQSALSSVSTLTAPGSGVYPQLLSTAESGARLLCRDVYPCWLASLPSHSSAHSLMVLPALC